MFIAVCGSRHFTDKEFVYRKLDEVIDQQTDDTIIIIQGGASGADALAVDYAVDHKLAWGTYEADWSRYGRSAGPIRNERMAVACDICVAFLKKGAENKGTKNMIKQVLDHKKNVYIFER